MSDSEFDTALVTAAFHLAGEEGWSKVNVVKAARAAGLSLPKARERFPSRAAILLRFGRLADQAALQDAPDQGPVRDRLFDLLMRRFDALQAHRAGVKALLRALPTDPPTALLLALATRRSMRWMLQSAGITATGTLGALQVRGLVAVWLWTLRAWDSDDSADLSGTMAALDTALQRAERAASWLGGQASAPPLAAEGAGELDPANPPPLSQPPLSSSSGSSPPASLSPEPSPPPGSSPPGSSPPGSSPSSSGSASSNPASPESKSPEPEV